MYAAAVAAGQVLLLVPFSETGDPRAHETAVAILRDESSPDWARAQSVRVLRNIADENDIPLLQEAFQRAPKSACAQEVRMTLPSSLLPVIAEGGEGEPPPPDKV